MFGIKIAPGSMKDASLSDKLMALGSALGGDMEGVAAIRQRNEREKLASLLAEELKGGGRLLPQQAQQAAPAAAPAPFDPIGQTSGEVVGRLQAQNGLMEAPKVGGLRPDPVAPPQMPDVGPQRGMMDRMLPLLAQAAGKGIDVSGMASLLRNEDYVRGLPQKDQAAARLDPSRYSGWQREDSLPLINEVAPGNVVTNSDRRTGKTLPVFEAPNRPDPVTTDRVIGAVVAKKSRGEELTPDEAAIFKRWQAGSDGFYGERAPQREPRVSPRQRVEEKIANGETLTAGEQKLVDMMQRNPFGGLGGGGEGDDEEGAPTPKPATRPATPAAALPKKAPAGPRQTPQQTGSPPPNALAGIPEGGQHTFANGQIWAKRGGKAQFVGMAK